MSMFKSVVSMETVVFTKIRFGWKKAAISSAGVKNSNFRFACSKNAETRQHSAGSLTANYHNITHTLI